MLGTPFTDPLALTLALMAAALVGLAKGGLGGLGVMAVPLMALVISPVQAAGIMLPILLVSDVFAVWTWWGNWNLRTLSNMLPGAVVGVAVGWATAHFVTDDVVRLIVGVVAVGFVLRWLMQSRAARAIVQPQRPAAGQFWGGVAGYTSFVAHAGGPPYNVYAMPLNLDPKVFTGTSVAFFAITNAIKLVPYYALGQLAAGNLWTSLILAPVAIVFTFVGAVIIRRMKAEVFYPVTYALTFALGVKLIWDGAASLL